MASPQIPPELLELLLGPEPRGARLGAGPGVKEIEAPPKKGTKAKAAKTEEETGGGIDLGTLLPILGIGGLAALTASLTTREPEPGDFAQQLFGRQPVGFGQRLGEIGTGLLQFGGALGELNARQQAIEQEEQQRNLEIAIGLLNAGRITPEEFQQFAAGLPGGEAIGQFDLQAPPEEPTGLEAAAAEDPLSTIAKISGAVEDGVMPPSVGTEILQSLDLLGPEQSLQAPAPEETDNPIFNVAEAIARNPRADAGVRSQALGVLRGELPPEALQLAIEELPPTPPDETTTLDFSRLVTAAKAGGDPDFLATYAQKLGIDVPEDFFTTISAVSAAEANPVQRLNAARGLMAVALQSADEDLIAKSRVILDSALADFTAGTAADKIPAANAARDLIENAAEYARVDPISVIRRISEQVDDINDPQLQQALEMVYGAETLADIESLRTREGLTEEELRFVKAGGSPEAVLRSRAVNR